jgi:hypothetical protein
MQKLALQASGANAVALGGLGMMSGIPPGLMASMLPGMGNGLSNTLETPTKVVALTQVVSADELKDDEEYDDILEDMREECGKFGMSFIPGRSHNIHICIQEPVSCFCARIWPSQFLPYLVGMDAQYGYALYYLAATSTHTI